MLAKFSLLGANSSLRADPFPTPLGITVKKKNMTDSLIQCEIPWEEAGKHNAVFFDKGCDKYGKVGWQAACLINEDVQRGIYHSLLSRIPTDGLSLLDLGCGQGDLIPFLYQNKKKISKYHGIDVSKRMIEIASEKYGHEVFTNCNFLDPKLSFDYDVIVAASAFNYCFSQDKNIQFEYLKAAISKMYNSCKRACSFTLLSFHGYDLVKDCNELVCYEPWDVLKFCVGLTSAVVIDHASNPAEFVVTLFHD